MVKDNLKEMAENQADLANQESADVSRPTTEAIRQRAYEIYVERGRTDGSDIADWLRAEDELMRHHSRLAV